MAKTVILEPLDWSKLISRKIWVTKNREISTLCVHYFFWFTVCKNENFSPSRMSIYTSCIESLIGLEVGFVLITGMLGDKWQINWAFRVIGAFAKSKSITIDFLRASKTSIVVSVVLWSRPQHLPIIGNILGHSLPFLAKLVHFLANLAIFGHFWSSLVQFCHFLSYLVIIWPILINLAIFGHWSHFSHESNQPFKNVINCLRILILKDFCNFVALKLSKSEIQIL